MLSNSSATEVSIFTSNTSIAPNNAYLLPPIPMSLSTYIYIINLFSVLACKCSQTPSSIPDSILNYRLSTIVVSELCFYCHKSGAIERNI